MSRHVPSSSPLVVDALHLSYGEVTAVDGVSFTAEAGQVTVVVGPNGAGKTSTIEVCEGFRNPDRGMVRVLGRDPGRHQSELSARVGVMLQEGGVYPGARVLETIAHYCAVYQRGVDPKALLVAVGLEAQAKQRWKQLSGGQKQRLSLALALAARPEVAFLDEPTSGVDLEGRDLIRRVVRDLADEGCAVLLATHELPEAEQMADRVIIFDQGRVAADGPLSKLRAGGEQVRIETIYPIDVSALSTELECPVTVERDPLDGLHRYRIEAAPDALRLAAITSWLVTNDIGLVSIEGGAETLETVYRRIVGGNGKPDRKPDSKRDDAAARPDAGGSVSDHVNKGRP